MEDILYSRAKFDVRIPLEEVCSSLPRRASFQNAYFQKVQSFEWSDEVIVFVDGVECYAFM